ncbi:hypothetical protein SARC_04206 [Sphaeroforma arctica JP610]|uniref:Uncharacterized protein n=1 Tax=Sphaeroforma arctica JP610 TaxID=667725 RepID=A0A0L0G3Z6_9EUKA|nr:hypothetical protein SARC_04206 [Sphaeroforma arctica JP610]KNC83559.1 hypothetical protein SARC_04206 [Sphaeroforma arctica JP610]|eukprot:XP_014157461.1 hypothetical protein SARC_04206 [Sphaeroforma arctica JP610]
MEHPSSPRKQITMTKEEEVAAVQAKLATINSDCDKSVPLGIQRIITPPRQTESPLHTKEFDERFYRAVHYCHVGDIDGLKKVLEEGLEVNHVDWDGQSLLHIAASEGHFAVARFLLEKGAKTSKRNRWGQMPIEHAVANQNEEMVSVLAGEGQMSAAVRPWNCENDKATLLLYHDILLSGGILSSALQGATAMSTHRQRDYLSFFQHLQNEGCKAVSLQDVILSGCHTPEFHEYMLDHIVCTTDDENVTQKEILSYKKVILQGMNMHQLGYAGANHIALNLKRAIDGRLECDKYYVEPLSDLLNERLQICTPKGVVLTTTVVDSHKEKILRHVFERLGLPIIANLPQPLQMNGKDYVPAGADLCFMGVGLGTNESSVRYLMKKEVFGTARVAVVRDIFDRSPERGYLDQVMKIVDAKSVLILDSIIGENNLNRRLVNEYVYCNSRNRYVLSRMNMELSAYIRDVGMNVVRLPESIYNTHGLGVFNFGEGQLLVNNAEIADILEGSAHFSGTVKCVTFDFESELKSDWIFNTTLVFRQKPAVDGMPTIDLKPFNPPTDRVQRAWGTSNDTQIHQTTNTVMMVAPVGFCTNEETAADNYFMHKHGMSADEVERKALAEFSEFHRKLTTLGVTVLLFVNERWYKSPDSVFPNNWFSTHSATEFDEKKSTVVFYPMKTESRRKERREYIISDMQEVYDREMSFTQWEYSDFPSFLESTGVIVADRKRRIAYIALSQRANRRIAETWAKRLGYTLCLFHATDAEMRPIYHTNVLMAVGSSCAVVCLESIEDKAERENLVKTLEQSHKIIAITRAQMNELCGNVLEVHGEPYSKRIMVMSTRAYNAFTDEQKGLMLDYVDNILHTSIDTIENIGGGGVRCMMGEIF